MKKIHSQMLPILLLTAFVASCQQEITLPPKPPQRSMVFDNYVNNKVDLLMVIGNTGGTEIRQFELAVSASAFVDNLYHYQSDFQIAVVASDMETPSNQGRFQSIPPEENGPPILKSSQLSKDELISYLQHQINLGSRGPLAQMGLEAMRKALSPDLINKENKGFLRQHSLLAILFVNYLDDCSFKYDETKRSLGSYLLCYLPKTISYQGQKGFLEDLYPVSSYIEFLQGLSSQKHRVMVAGIIGDPNQQAVQNCVEPDEYCKGDGPGQICMYRTPSVLSCGGCLGTKAEGYPGLRYSQLIRSISGEGYWFSICNQDPQTPNKEQVLLDIAALINEHLHYIVLKKPIEQIDKVDVFFTAQGATKVSVPYAPQTKQACKQDTDCTKNSVCGAEQVCYGDGWVYFPTQGRFQPKIKISGKYQAMLTDTTRVLVQVTE